MGAGIVMQKDKPLLGMLTCRPGVLATQFLTQPPAPASWEAADDGPSAWGPATPIGKGPKGNVISLRLPCLSRAPFFLTCLFLST